ncbi:NADH-quinone oxidoreductase subunit NuoG [Pseudoflavitalea sp. X16]|nr:NADH-quinone oxidoreductase subunit NuoG [Paraflavitalea devenefica]
MPTIYIHNKPYEVKAGKNLLEAALSLGFDLPYFCWHPALGSVGACRQCAVKLFKDEQDTHGRLVMSCMETVKEGMRLSIEDQTAKAFRKQVIEWLMTNHPHDCPVCDEGGSCHLQDMTVMTGHDYRRYEFKKRTYRNQYLGPLIHHEMNRCIQCYRCVRFYHDYAGGNDLNVFAAHHHVYFGREKEGILESPFSGNLAEVCPTGVFTDKTLKEHYTRKWDLTTAPSVCQHCSLGCNTIVGERYGKLRSVVNRFNSEVNGYFLCDKGRYGYEFVNSENRITQPIIRNRAVEAVDETTLMAHLRNTIAHHKLIGIGSPRASVESNFSLMQLVGKDNFYQGVAEDEAFLQKKVVDILQSGAVRSASLKDIDQADAVLILGEDVWNTAPIMALAVRQAVMKTAAAEAAQQIAIPAWNDAAVKEKVQENKGFLANCTILPSPLDEIAATTQRCAPDDIARLGFAIAHLLNPSLPSVPGISEETAQKAKDIAAALQQARQPVIISGTSSCNEALLRAAFNIAAALHTGERKAALSYVLPECNSMGLAMMQAPSFERAAGRVKREQDITAIILENDIYRHIPAHKADTFLSHCKYIIALDSLNNLTTQKAHTLIPAATFAEGDGTLVNNEGRAQRFCQVFVPTNNLVRESWKWLWQMKALQSESGNGQEHHPDELLAKLETAMPQFAGIAQVAPPHDFRIHGEAIPREPHRYSGRTAMLANLAVSEPKPLQDDDSPLTFTMEGYQGMPPSPLIPFFWAPGWNSVQSVNKYQQETGGALRGGDPGIRLFEQKGIAPVFFREIPEVFIALQQKWLLLPRYQLFGSSELSGYTRALRELSADPYISLSKQDAAQLGAVDGAPVSIKADGTLLTLPLKIDEALCNGIVLAPAGLPGVATMSWGTRVNIEVLKFEKVL